MQPGATLKLRKEAEQILKATKKKQTNTKTECCDETFYLALTDSKTAI